MPNTTGIKTFCDDHTSVKWITSTFFQQHFDKCTKINQFAVKTKHLPLERNRIVGMVVTGLFGCVPRQ